jgi:hypothetical protein
MTKTALRVFWLGLGALLWATFGAFGQAAQPVNVYCLNSSGVAVPWFSAAGVWQCAANLPVTVTPSGTQNVNLTQIIGAAPSTTNPLWVLFGTGATLPAFASPPTVIVSAQARAARNFPGCTVTNSSAQCLAAATAVQFVQVQNTHASAAIACNWGGTAVLNSSGSFQLAAGQSASWGPNTGGVPNEALNCIASVASAPLYLEWN